MSLPNRRTVISLAGLGLLGASQSAWAAYPEKPIKLIVPWAAGGVSSLGGGKLLPRIGLALILGGLGIVPAPRPWMKRAPTSTGMDGASPPTSRPIAGKWRALSCSQS